MIKIKRKATINAKFNLNRLVYFAAVVNTGSFTRAAENLGVTKAVVSQQVARLEEDTGVTLLIRTTRYVHPTEAGKHLHARCMTILGETENAFDELAQAVEEPTGLLRLSAPYDYASAMVMKVATDFCNRYPNCKIELKVSDQKLDIYNEKLDIDIRLGWLADSTSQARKIGTFRQLIVGSPKLGERIRTACNPDEIVDFPFIANLILNDPLYWHFSGKSGELASLEMNAVMFIDSTSMVLSAVREGAGLSVLPDFMVNDDIKSGKLVQVIPDWQLPSGGIYTVYPSAKFRPSKVSIFTQMLYEAEQNRINKFRG
ncbi:LysR family transcriptional regulator [Candidatus Symbiopectobacterium sp. NZEC151]|uniref:LysR family transcriptional regulator n=2 Tax=unclassified Symbiopectobacterium TaxID=2794573 RepID=UPI0022265407|nr:LysR family transcriptional regulator [Candidatus Symbiopectobacterium sp. NZEC151]MCW2474185.1 LysR family transcriptional regulator [Candidatus Symbiopectobacterium sp. NZEC151]